MMKARRDGVKQEGRLAVAAALKVNLIQCGIDVSPHLQYDDIYIDSCGYKQHFSRCTMNVADLIIELSPSLNISPWNRPLS